MNLHPVDAIGVLYVEVPKAACTSIKFALAPSKRPEPGPEEPGALHRWFGYTYAVDEAELDAWIAAHWADYFCFTIVRHPLDRFESMFYSKVNTRSIDRFARGFSASAWSGDPHGQRQVDLIGRDLSRYDLVGRLEDLRPVEVALTRLLGRPITLPHANASKRGPGLGPAARARIAEHYAEDFEVLGYCR